MEKPKRYPLYYAGVMFLLGLVNLVVFANYEQFAPAAYAHGHRGWFNLVVGAGLVIFAFFRLYRDE